MAATLTISRSCTLSEGVPTITLNVTAVQNISSDIFIYKVSDMGEDFDEYLSIATLSQLTDLGTVRTGGVTYYRKSSALIKYGSITSALEDKIRQQTLLQDLLSEYNSYSTSFVGDDVLELSSDD